MTRAVLVLNAGSSSITCPSTGPSTLTCSAVGKSMALAARRDLSRRGQGPRGSQKLWRFRRLPHTKL